MLFGEFRLLALGRWRRVHHEVFELEGAGLFVPVPVGVGEQPRPGGVLAVLTRDAALPCLAVGGESLRAENPKFISGES
jgi:hypothetical protein